jgi:CRISPR-associated protein Csh1
MLQQMRQVALETLASEFGATKESELWYEEARLSSADKLLKYLVEPPESEANFYTLRADPNDSETAILEQWQTKAEHLTKLPFNQPTGSQSAALGPLIKRTFANNTPGPSSKIQKTTLDTFDEIGGLGNSWSIYFAKASDCFNRKKLDNRVDGKFVEAKDSAFAEAIRSIPEKKTVLLAFMDERQRLPGDVPEYQQYLLSTLALTKYSTAKAPPVSQQECCLCSQVRELFPNAVKGAGINIVNIDRQGAFPNLDIDSAWKHYSLCVACADLLYVYNFHISEKYFARIAGEKALLIPSIVGDFGLKRKLLDRISNLATAIDEGTTGKGQQITKREASILGLLKDSEAITDLTILWADFGQRIEDVRGMITDVLPSRLQAIEQTNLQSQEFSSPVFPEYPLEEFRFDLSFIYVNSLLRRFGNKRNEKENSGKRLFDIKRDVAEAIYKQRSLPSRFQDELFKTMQSYFCEVLASSDWRSMQYEGYLPKKGTSYLTFAGWIRHLAKIFHHFRQLKVLPMPGPIYEPQLARLQPFFTAESAIDSKAKAYCFLLGVLYGKTIQVQAARGVNVSANALTWLKRLTLDSSDLPELYVKIREKLLAYETEANADVRALSEEIAVLGTQVNASALSNLSQIETNYFLLLGQSLSNKILPSQSKSNS